MKIRGSLWVFFSMSASALIMLVGIKVLTSLISTSEYGRIALALSVVNFGVQVVGTSLSSIFIRFYPTCRTEAELQNLHSFVARILAFSLSALCLVIAICFYFIFDPDSSVSFELFILTLFLMISLTANRCILGVFDGARMPIMRAKNQIAMEFFRYSAAVLLIFHLSEYTAEAAILGFLIGSVLVMSSNIKYIFRDHFNSIRNRIEDRGKLQDSKYFLSYGRPLFLSNSFIWIVMFFERWILSYFGTDADVGGYFAIHQLSFLPMAILASVFTIILAPIVFHEREYASQQNKEQDDFRKTLYLGLSLFFASAIISVITYFAHETIANLLLGESFRVYGWIYPWLIFAGGCFAGAQQLFIKLSAEYRSGTIAFAWASIAALALTLYTFGTYAYGLHGLVASVAFCNGCLFILSLWLFHKKA